MKIIGCDYHPGFQQIAMLDQQTGELTERRLRHEGGEARRFYQQLQGEAVLVGMESTGNAQWFEQLLAQLGHRLWVGDAARIRAMQVRKQKTDSRDAWDLLQLLIEGRFPRLWVPTVEERDARQLLLHRHKLVGMRTRVKNELQHLALNQGLQRKYRLWSKTGRAEFDRLPLLPWAAWRRAELLRLLEHLEGSVAELDRAVAREAQARASARLLMTHPGVGPVTALAFVLTLGPVERFARGKQVASYFGLIPAEHSSGGKQRLGHISKQGNSFLRFLLVEAAQSAVRRDPEMGRDYRRLAAKKSRAVAKVAAARKLAVRLYWMLREQKPHAQLDVDSHVGQPGSFRGRNTRPCA